MIWSPVPGGTPELPRDDRADHDRARVVGVSRSSDRTIGGAMIWLSLDDLTELGIDPDVEEVAYVVDDGELKTGS